MMDRRIEKFELEVSNSTETFDDQKLDEKFNF